MVLVNRDELTLLAETGRDATQLLTGADAVGVVADATFLPGSDSVTFKVPGLAAGAVITIELLYASVSPRIIDAVTATKTPASVVFAAQTAGRPVTPTVMTRTTYTW